MEKVEVWYSPGDIKFEREHIEWLLKHYDLLHSGRWPPEYKETGYKGKSSNKKNHSAPFEPAIQMAVELDERLKLICLNGLIIHDIAIKGMSVEDVAEARRMRDIEGRYNNGLERISHWRRPGPPFNIGNLIDLNQPRNQKALKLFDWEYISVLWQQSGNLLNIFRQAICNRRSCPTGWQNCTYNKESYEDCWFWSILVSVYYYHRLDPPYPY